MNKMKVLLCLMFAMLISECYADHKIDSLENLLKHPGRDTSTLKSYLYLANAYTYVDAEKGLRAIEKAFDLARLLKIRAGIRDAYRMKGLIQSSTGNTDKAIESYEMALALTDTIKDPRAYAAMVVNMGLCYYQKTDYNKALQYFLKAERQFEKTGMKRGLGSCYLNSGLIFDALNNKKLALDYYNKALAIYQELNAPAEIVRCYLNLGTFWMKDNEFEKAKSCFYAGEKIALEINDVNGLAQLASNTGLVYDYAGKNDSALFMYGKALKFAEEAGDIHSVSGILGNIGFIYMKEKKYALALENFQQTLDMVKSSGQYDFLAETYLNLAKCYRGMNRNDKAFDYLELYAKTKDTLMSEQNNRALIEMETKYQSEKKDNEIKILSKDKELQEATVFRQRVVIYSAACALLIVLTLAALIYRNFVEKKKANLLLEQRNAEIQHQKDIIEEKNKDILDSITYAKRIQQSLLPTETYIQRRLQATRKS